MASVAAVRKNPKSYNLCQCGRKKHKVAKLCRTCFNNTFFTKCKCGRRKYPDREQCFRCNQRDNKTLHDRRRIDQKQFAKDHPLARIPPKRITLKDDCPDCNGFCYKQDNIGWYVCHTCLGSGSQLRKGDREGGTYVRRNDERNDPSSIHRRLTQQR